MFNGPDVGALVRTYAIVDVATHKVDVVKAIDSQKAVNEAVHSYPQHNTTTTNQELTNYFSYEITDAVVARLKHLSNDTDRFDYLRNRYPKPQSWQV